MNIESFFPGRIRVSSALFARQEGVDQALAALSGVDGVKKISNNLLAGSLTIEYDAAKITMPMLMQAKDELEAMERNAAGRDNHKS